MNNEMIIKNYSSSTIGKTKYISLKNSDDIKNVVCVTFLSDQLVHCKYERIVLEVPYGTDVLYTIKVLRAFKNKIRNLRTIVACKLDNVMHNLSHVLVANSIISFVSYKSSEGRRILNRTIRYVFYMSVFLKSKDIIIKYDKKLGRDEFFQINKKLTDNDIEEISNNMKLLIKNSLEIRKKMVPFTKIKEIYTNMNYANHIENYEKDENFDEKFTLYSCEFSEIKYFNYLYGVIAPFTNYIKDFCLRKYKDNIIILTLPKKENMYKAEVDNDNEINYELYQKANLLKPILMVDSVSKLNELYISPHVDEKTKINYNVDEYIRLSELRFNVNVINVANKIVKDNKMIVLVTGPSSSGKTTFSKALRDQLIINDKKCIPIHMDDYFKDAGEERKPDFESICHVDLKLFKQKIKSLLSGKETMLPTFNFKTGKKEYKSGPTQLEENSIIIIEGIHALNPVTYSDFDENYVYKIYISPISNLYYDKQNKISSNDVRKIRRTVRDFLARGRDVEATFILWDKVCEAESKNIYPYIKNSDAIINSFIPYELSLYKETATKLFMQISKESFAYAEARRLLKMLNNFVFIVKVEQIPKTSLLYEFMDGGAYKDVA